MFSHKSSTITHDHLLAGRYLGKFVRHCMVFIASGPFRYKYRRDAHECSLSPERWTSTPEAPVRIRVAAIQIYSRADTVLWHKDDFNRLCRLRSDQ